MLIVGMKMEDKNRNTTFLSAKFILGYHEAVSSTHHEALSSTHHEALSSTHHEALSSTQSFLKVWVQNDIIK